MGLSDKFEGGEGVGRYIFDVRVVGHVGSNEYNKSRETKFTRGLLLGPYG